MTAPTNDEYAEMARERRAEWDRSVKWATAAAAKCGNPSTVALLMAMRAEWFLIDFEQFSRRVREMTARMELVRLTDEMERCSARCTKIAAEGPGKPGLEALQHVQRYLRESKRRDTLQAQYDAANARWVKELGI